MSRYIARQGQWLGDTVIRESGDIAALFETAARNGISVTGTPAPGTEMETVPPATPEAKAVVNCFRNRDIHPATALNAGADGAPGGIGYMAVGITFIIDN
jgi:hypothetical protein